MDTNHHIGGDYVLAARGLSGQALFQWDTYRNSFDARDLHAKN